MFTRYLSHQALNFPWASQLANLVIMQFLLVSIFKLILERCWAPYSSVITTTKQSTRKQCAYFLRYALYMLVNSLAPGRPRCHFKTAIFNLVSLIGIFTSSNDNALRWMPWDLTDDESTLVQVMAWCHQASRHYLSQCTPSSMSPYGITRPQWVNLLWPSI